LKTLQKGLEPINLKCGRTGLCLCLLLIAGDVHGLSGPNLPTILFAKTGPIPFTMPRPRYFSIPSAVVGGHIEIDRAVTGVVEKDNAISIDQMSPALRLNVANACGRSLKLKCATR
jgi:hypothetical protein